MRRPGPAHAIEGYADAVSVIAGEPFRLFVSTSSPSFTVSAFRLGWYRGAAARLLWRSGAVRGRRQAPARLIAATRTVTAPWCPSVTARTDGWPPGDYLLRLDASAGAQSMIPLTVRTAVNAGRVVLMNAVTTWQAYNAYGGRDLYAGPDRSYHSRSYAVSFDRPYENGPAAFLRYELPLVTLAERLGLDLGYTTSVDLDRDPGSLDGARAFISPGHDEYWSTAMRRTVQVHRDTGMNIAFLGANAVFRHVRFAATALGERRLLVDYKDAALDPDHRPADATVNWRDAPLRLPESELTGMRYESNPVHTDMLVSDPAGWLFAGTAVRRGSRLAGLVGIEYDRVNAASPIPQPMEVLAQSPVVCRGVHSYADMEYYTDGAGGAVFDTGTTNWVPSVADAVEAGPAGGLVQRVVAKVTQNLLLAFATGPAGRLHPAHGNLSSVNTWPGDPVASRHDLWK